MPNIIILITHYLKGARKKMKNKLVNSDGPVSGGP